MKSGAALRKGSQLIGIVALLGILTGLIFCSRPGDNDRTMLRRDARLISFQPLSESEFDGEMCLVPASTSRSLISLLAQEKASSETAAEQRPSDSIKAELAKRKPVRTVQDPNPAFSAIALDLNSDEVIIQDENTYGINIYNRLDNTPASARMTEPKRTIRGEATHLEFNCGLYVDPANGDIYTVNNDTLNLLSIFSHDAKGNVAPKRVLNAPYFHGIAVDEERQEMFMSSQGGTVAVWKKTAQGDDPPLRFIKGNKTELADPHGIALDAKRGLVFVTNWGTRDEIQIPAPSTVPWGDGRTWKGDGTQGGNTGARSIPGSGQFRPPSITVYSNDAMGDVAPLRLIQGTHTQLNWPVSIAVDSGHGELFVANDTGNSITVYSVEAVGDVAPLRVIQGPNTLIKNPTGVTYDAKHDEIWVSNFSNHAATVFKRTAAGDISPLRVIRSAPLDAPTPMMGNPHVVVYDSKRDQILVGQ